MLDIHHILDNRQVWLTLGFRFLYGLRNITPFAIGMSQMPTRRFVILNAIGAAIWAATFAGGGYLFGMAMETFLAGQQKWLAIGALLAVATIVWVVRIIRRRRGRPERATPRHGVGGSKRIHPGS